MRINGVQDVLLDQDAAFEGRTIDSHAAFKGRTAKQTDTASNKNRNKATQCNADGSTSNRNGNTATQRNVDGSGSSKAGSKRRSSFITETIDDETLRLHNLVSHAEQVQHVSASIRGLLDAGKEAATLAEINVRLTERHSANLHPLHPLAEHLRTQSLLQQSTAEPGRSAMHPARIGSTSSHHLAGVAVDELQKIKQTQLKEILEYKFPLEIALVILNDVSLFNFDDERKLDAKGAGRLALSLTSRLLSQWQTRAFAEGDNASIMHYFNLNRIMHDVLGPLSKYGSRSHFFEGIMLTKLSHKLPCVIDYAGQ